MKASTFWKSKAWHRAEKPLGVCIWLAIWHIASVTLGQEILLVSPARAFFTLIELLRSPGFYAAVGYTFLRILAGFLLAMITGVTLAALAKAFPPFRSLVSPAMQAVKATPVASFVILALIWFSSGTLSVFITFLMGLPIFYINILQGLESADGKILEMGKVFRVSLWRRTLAIYAPSAYPFFLGAITASLGFCWKAGVAAEVIGVPDGSIGEALYRAKLFLDTPSLFAWTIAIILLSVGFEKLVLTALRKLPTPDRAAKS